MKTSSNDYVTRVMAEPGQIDAAAWNALVAAQDLPTPFVRHEYLAALHDSGSAQAASGWAMQWLTLWRGDALCAACPLYLKAHSYGEYVFDWAWANAYAQHGLEYYPKALVAVPFTPVPGSRLLARDAAARAALVRAMVDWVRGHGLSSLHLLFLSDADRAACEAAGLMGRQTVQFHWLNAAPTDGAGDLQAAPGPTSGVTDAPGSGRRWHSFDDFLASLAQDKRKKIRQERRKVAEAGVSFEVRAGREIETRHWDFFYRCYERTYREHGNPPYLTRDFFARMQAALPEAWVLFTAVRGGRPIATSLIAVQAVPDCLEGQNGLNTAATGAAYGRYWGALERVDCLHFEACYYQPIEWCIARGVARFEGGAQGEHKMARALMPAVTHSAHWLAHPSFADAVERFLAREGQGVAQYLEHLEARSPFRQPAEGKP